MNEVSRGNYNLIEKEKIKQSIQRVLDAEETDYSYSTPKGLKELRIAIRDFLKQNRNLTANESNMIITTGSQQSLNLIAYGILKEKDTIFVEEPTYFRSTGYISKSKFKNACHPDRGKWN